MRGDILLFRNLILILASLLSANSVHAANNRPCDYKDYSYIPHPDQTFRNDPPKIYRMRIEHNPGFVGPQGGTREYYYIDTLNPQASEIYSTIKMPFECTASGYIHCTLNVKGSPASYRFGRLDVGILKNFSSDSMKSPVPYALSIPGLPFTTKNWDYADEIIVKRPPKEDYLPYLLPSLWVSDKQTGSCTPEAK